MDQSNSSSATALPDMIRYAVTALSFIATTGALIYYTGRNREQTYTHNHRTNGRDNRANDYEYSPQRHRRSRSSNSRAPERPPNHAGTARNSSSNNNHLENNLNIDRCQSGEMTVQPLPPLNSNERANNVEEIDQCSANLLQETTIEGVNETFTSSNASDLNTNLMVNIVDSENNTSNSRGNEEASEVLFDNHGRHLTSIEGEHQPRIEDVGDNEYNMITEKTKLEKINNLVKPTNEPIRVDDENTIGINASCSTVDTLFNLENVNCMFSFMPDKASTQNHDNNGLQSSANPFAGEESDILHPHPLDSSSETSCFTCRGSITQNGITLNCMHRYHQRCFMMQLTTSNITRRSLDAMAHIGDRCLECGNAFGDASNEMAGIVLDCKHLFHVECAKNIGFSCI